MKKTPLSRRRPPVIYLFLIAIIVVTAATVATLVSGGEKPPRVETAAKVAAPPHQRLTLPSYRGVSEPQADAWWDMLMNIERLKNDNINTVAIQPPVLASLQSGRQRRVALEGDVIAAPRAVADLHQAGMAVMLAPTTEDYLIPSGATADQFAQLLGSSAVRQQLDEDVLKWAQTAEDYQVELFAPLEAFNLVLGGSDAAGGWGQAILPRIRERYSGPLAASVVPGSAPAAPGEPYDFERLDYRGYDYLMLSIQPEGESFDAAAWQAQVEDLLARAEAVVTRDGLKGVIVGDFGGWREGAGAPGALVLGADGQAQAAATLLETALPRAAGFFYHGWTLPGRGAKDAPVEEVLRQFYGM